MANLNRIETIVDALLKHNTTKSDAIQMLQDIFDEQRKNGSLEFEVEEVAFSIENNHGFIKAKIPYGYSEMENKIKKGVKIDVLVVY